MKKKQNHDEEKSNHPEMNEEHIEVSKDVPNTVEELIDIQDRCRIDLLKRKKLKRCILVGK